MRMKHFFPYEKYLLTTKMPISEVNKRLEDNIEPINIFRSLHSRRNPDKPYEGEMIDNELVINRIINYRNSLQPLIEIETSSLFGETHLKIIIKLPRIGKLFIVGWLVLGITIILAFVSSYIYQTQASRLPGFYQYILYALAFPFVGIPLPYLILRYESRKAKRFFTNLFNAQQIN